jgi:serine protease Do
MKSRYVLLALIFVLACFTFWQARQITALADSVGALKTSVATLGVEVVESASSTAASAAEMQRREQVVAKSEDQQLQDAVAAVTPAVVSIVESQEVPKLQVTYENPFGNDPYFQGFGVEVPVYQQIGTTTQEIGAGTGFLVRSNGYIITNKHVVPDVNATYTVLLSNGKQKNGTVVWRSSSEDLAVVKISGSGFTSVSLGDSSALNLGESVFAVGNALGQYNNSVSVGVISGLNRTIQAANESGQVETLTGVIQTDAAINPGNSGGPLVDLNGDVVAVNVATAEGSQSIGFSIPISEVESALKNLGI